MAKLISRVLLCLATLSFQGPFKAQEPSMRRPASINATSSEREQDGLVGPVRRVRVESAKMVVKEGKPSEGPRVVRRVMTYDLEGKRIDAVNFPSENPTQAGKEQYRYDDKGNAIEMVLLGDNGVILGKELYQYEFDELGNWKKMTTSVAVYENGQVGSEPMEVTYRTITYYYSQAIDAMEKGTTDKHAATSSAKPSQRSQKKVEAAPTKMPPTIEEKSSGVRLQGEAARQPGNDAGKQVVKPENQTALTAKIEVAKPSNSPAPRSPLPAENKNKESGSLAGSSGANETRPAESKSTVPSSTTSPDPTAVARNDDKAVKMGSSAPSENRRAANKPSSSSVSTSDPAGAKNDNRSAVNRTSSEGLTSSPANNSPTKSNPTSTSPTSPAEPPREAKKDTTPAPANPSVSGSAEYYERGLSYLKTGKPSQAVAALKQAVFLNPEDAMAYSKLGVAYSALGQYREALAVFDLAIRIKPEAMNSEAYYRMAEAYTGTGKSSEALKSFKQALYIKRAELLEGDAASSKQFPTLADLQFGLGLAYYNMESFSDAIRELKKATELDPSSADAHYGLAMAYIAKGDRGNAQKEERLLRPLDAAKADNIAAALTNVLPRGVTRIEPREDRRTRP